MSAKAQALVMTFMFMVDEVVQQELDRNQVLLEASLMSDGSSRHSTLLYIAAGDGMSKNNNGISS